MDEWICFHCGEKLKTFNDLLEHTRKKHKVEDEIEFG